MTTQNKIFTGILSLGIISSLAFTYKKVFRSIPKKIVQTAKKYLYIRENGQCNNCGFNDFNFQTKLELLGWKPQWDWCLFFVELVILEAFADLGLKKHYNFVLRNFEKGSTQATWRNLRQSNSELIEFHSQPCTGCLAFWRRWSYDKSKGWHANPLYGHVGIVVKVEPNSFITIEGNVSNRVKYKRRILSYNKLDGKLQLLGFVSFKS